MNNLEIEKMAKMEKEYWWHVGKKYLIKSLIDHYFPSRNNLKILELGCGTGEITSCLKTYGNVTAFDISQSAVDFCKSKGILNVSVNDITTLDTSNYKNAFDLVLALDVLEHIQDDVAVIQKIKEMLKPEGYFFINVPAHKFMWSEHDEALEHKRRYHRLELTKKVKDSGFNIVSNTYFVTLASPLIILYRIWSNIFGKSAYPKTSYVLLPKYLNDFLINLLKLETKMILHGHIPFGVTLNVIAKNAKNDVKSDQK